MSKPSEFVVLAEDERHQRLVRRYLQRLYKSPAIRNRELPSSRGCGEQWVRERYVAEVKDYRRRSAHAKTVLIVAIDADNHDVDWRARQLRESLKQADLRQREKSEAIVHLIPKRNVETWILCLNDKSVDESTDYSQHKGIDGLIPSAAGTLFIWSRPNAILPMSCVPSLSTAIPEIRRME